MTDRISEIMCHALGTVEVIQKSTILDESAKLFAIHEASGIFTSLERALNAANYKLETIAHKAQYRS